MQRNLHTSLLFCCKSEDKISIEVEQMSDEKNRDYKLGDFDSKVKTAKAPYNNEPDYGDEFEAQIRNKREDYNPNEYYVSRSGRRNRKKEKRRKIKNAVIVSCIAIVCILVVLAFALTRCSMPKIELSLTTAPTLPMLVRETMVSQDETTEKTEDEVVQTEEPTVMSNETIVEETDEILDESEILETEKSTQEIEIEPDTGEVVEIPDPEVELYGQDQDY